MQETYKQRVKSFETCSACEGRKETNDLGFPQTCQLCNGEGKIEVTKERTVNGSIETREGCKRGCRYG